MAEERIEAVETDATPLASVRSGEPDVDEPNLIDRAIAGDAEAFADLYTRYVDRVYRHAYYYLGNRVDAEDVAQQTFLRAWQAMGRYERGEAPFLAWLLTIAGRSAISQLRRSRELTGDADLPDEPAENDPQEIVAMLNSRDLVRDAVLRLSPDRQQVVVLRFIEGLSIAEVAAALGKTEGNVSVLQHRALGDLRRILNIQQSRRVSSSRVVRTVRHMIVRATELA